MRSEVDLGENGNVIVVVVTRRLHCLVIHVHVYTLAISRYL